MHGPVKYYKTKDPLTESIERSNLAELTAKDEEYTKKAIESGETSYKWNTDIMTLLIYENGIEENNEVPGIWKFISHWLALQLKFVEDEQLQYYAKEFYEGRFHYLDEYKGDTIYHRMYKCDGSYLYTIYYAYLRSKDEFYPDYIRYLKDVYFHLYNPSMAGRIPNSDGTKLIKVSHEEAEKYNGEWRSEEEREASRKRRRKYHEQLKQKGLI